MTRRRWVLAVVLALLVPVGVSWGRVVAASSQESIAARSAEWMRDHHLGFVVDRVEQYQYEHDQPKSGGRPAAALLRRGRSTSAVAAGTAPAPMPTRASPPFAGEGVWTPAGPPSATGAYGVYTTRIRPNALKTSLVDFVARIDPRLVTVQIVAGTKLPGGSWSHPSEITPAECPRAILALNGGFRFDQSEGGWYADGHEAAGHPLVDGAASLVRFRNGTMTVGAWGTDIRASQLPAIDTVRQNLKLMVDHGAVVPTIDDGPVWGARLKNSLFVWRSGYGVTKDGMLVYVGGPGLTPRDLAERLVDAGAVRAMQGDINPAWVTSNLYRHTSSGCHGTKALDAPTSLGGQKSSGDRYLTSDTRDFVEVLAKR
ncbi:MAG: hypothetical protein U0Q22_14315 [Acidimicrobiales bacterium]